MFEVRCGDGFVMLDLEADIYSCRYDPACVCTPTADAAMPHWTDMAPLEVQLGAQDLAQFARAYVVAILTFPGRPLRRLLNQRFRADRASFAKPTLNVLVARFERMSLYLPFVPSCLLKSFALRRYLRLYGFDADWIVGVQLFPFAAHCWLAVGDILLAERAHLIEDYVPILRRLRQA
jgi:hypothetical protein